MSTQSKFGVALAAMLLAVPAFAQSYSHTERSESYSSEGGRHVWQSETTTSTAAPPPPPPQDVITTHRTVIRNYYQNTYRDNCPPGFAMQGGSCVSQAPAAQVAVGQPLPAGTVYYDLPQPLVTQLGSPPPGYRYVRVGGDVLMISSGTGVVVQSVPIYGGG